MNTSYDVRIWKKIREYTSKKTKKTTYTVRWLVAGEEKHSPHESYALADAFRSELVAASRKGEAFDIATGLPVSKLKKAASETSWYQFAVEHADRKWARASGTYRRDIARTLTTATVAMLPPTPSGFTGKELRKALRDWAFNKGQRENAPQNVVDILAWARRNSKPMAAIEDGEQFDRLMTALSVNLDGKSAANSTIQRNRAIMHNALKFAVQKHLLTENPIKLGEVEKIRTVRAIDKRRVLNSTQARAALAAVKKQKPSGSRVHAFLAVMYFAALRPEEVVSLYVRDVVLPTEGGWGEITVSEPQPEIGKRWTDSGEVRDQRRQPKGRAVGEVRHVPCYPELTVILLAYIAARKLKPNDKLFTGVRGGDLSAIVVRKGWSTARLEVLGEDIAGPDGTTTRVVRVITGKKIYDLRHACLTGWLNSGVPAAQVAEWAGNSVPVLLATYAKCISGQEEDYKRRIEEGLKLRSTEPREPPAVQPPIETRDGMTGESGDEVPDEPGNLPE